MAACNYYSYNMKICKKIRRLRVTTVLSKEELHKKAFVKPILAISVFIREIQSGQKNIKSYTMSHVKDEIL